MNKILPFFGHSSLNNHQGREFFSLFLNIKTVGAFSHDGVTRTKIALPLSKIIIKLNKINVSRKWLTGSTRQ